MQKTKNKLLTFLLAIAMVFTMMPMPIASAADTNTTVTITKKWEDNLTGTEANNRTKPTVTYSYKTDGEAYAVYDSSDQSLTFFRDVADKYTNKQVIGTKTYYTGIEKNIYASDNIVPWTGNLKSIKTVNFTNTIKPKSMYRWFATCTNLTTINNMKYLDTSECRTMEELFAWCKKLSTFDLSYMNTSKVTNMCLMFDEAFINTGSLGRTTLDLIKFDLSKVTNIGRIFRNCNRDNIIIHISQQAADNEVLKKIFSSLPPDSIASFHPHFTIFYDSGIDLSVLRKQVGVYGYIENNYGTDGYTTYCFRTGSDPSEYKPKRVSEITKTSVSGSFSSWIKTNDDTWTASLSFPSDYTSGKIYESSVPTGYTADTSSSSQRSISSNKATLTNTEKTATLTYNNGGHGTAPAIETMYYTTKTNAAPAISADGYVFTGWKRSDNGQVIQPGDEVKAASVIPSELTLTAQWLKVVTITKEWNDKLTGESANDRNTPTIKLSYSSQGVSDTATSLSSNWNKIDRDTWNYVFNIPEDAENLKVWESNIPKGYDTDADENHKKDITSNYATITNTRRTEMFAEFDSGTNTLRIFRDDEDQYKNGEIINSKTYYSGIEKITEKTEPKWYEKRGSVTKVNIEDTFKPKTAFCMFSGMKELTSITGMSNLDTRNVTDMESMFQNCKKLTTADLSDFNTDNVSCLDNMFDNCSSLNILDLSNFTTSSVISMTNIFRNCENLSEIAFGEKSIFTSNPPISDWRRVSNLSKTQTFNSPEIINISDYDGTAPGWYKHIDKEAEKVQRLITEINNKIDDIKTMDLSVYTDATVNVLNTAVSAAKSLINKNGVTSAELESAKSNIETALSNLKTKEAQMIEDSKNALSKLIAEAKALKNVPGVTNKEISVLTNAIIPAERILNDADATLNDINAEMKKLKNIVDGVNEYINKKDAIEKAETVIDEVTKLNLDGIDDDLKKALKDNIDILDKLIKSENSLSNDIDKAIKNLEKLLSDINKAKLDLENTRKDAENKITEAEKIDKSKLTDESKKSLENAIEEAKKIINNKNSTKTQIQQVIEKLTTVIKNLQTPEKTTSPQTDTSSVNNIPSVINNEIEPDKPVQFNTAEKAVLSQSGNKDVKGSTYRYLQLKSKKQGKKNIKLSWKRVKGANAYTVYGGLAGKPKMKKLKAVSGTKFNVKKIGKKLNSKKYYKFIVIASNGDAAQAIAKTVFVTPKGPKKVMNNTKVAVNKKVIKKAKKLKKGKKFSVKAKALKAKGTKVKKYAKVRYESSNAKIAKVNSKGKLKAIGKGSCKVYCYAQNGISKVLKVKVK